MAEIAKSSGLMSRVPFLPIAAALILVFAFGVLGCGAKHGGPGSSQGRTPKKEAGAAASQEDAQKQVPYIHTVRYSGETLSIIAQWYTGQMSNWEEIARANPGMNPNQIELDDKVVIPRALLKTDKPMPSSFVQEFLPKPKPPQKKKADPPAAPPPKKEAAPSKVEPKPAPESKSPAAKPAPAKSPPQGQSPPVIFGPKDF